MKIQELGHVVLQVTDLDRSLAFYRDVLGLPVASLCRIGPSRMAFFSLGQKHHDFAIRELPPGASANDPSKAGVFHVAFKVGADLADLKDAKRRIDAAKVPVVRTTEHMVTWSLYVSDPDGITVELYVDRDPAGYKDHPQPLGAIANPLPL